jgi:hypothetical protein
MNHAWEPKSIEFVGIQHLTRLCVWHCKGCDTVVVVSDALNETLEEFLNKSGYPSDCETTMVRFVLEQ